MADLPHYSDSNSDTGVGSDRGSTTSTPHWVKVFTLAASHRVLAWSGTAGIVVPLLFLAVAITHGLLHTDHSLVSMPISALAAGSSGWIQSTNFIVTGLLTVPFAAGIHQGARQSRADVIGPAFLALFIATGALVVRLQASLHACWGLAQLALLAVWFPCVIALAWRVRRFAAS